MTTIKLEELRALFDWIVSEAGNRWGDELPLDQDFYRSTDLGTVFRNEEQSQPVSYGSLSDEVNFLRSSVLQGQEDLLDVVAERVAYLLLAIADVAERES